MHQRQTVHGLLDQVSPQAGQTPGPSSFGDCFSRIPAGERGAREIP